MHSVDGIDIGLCLEFEIKCYACNILNFKSLLLQCFDTVISLLSAHRWSCVCALDWAVIAGCTINNNN